MTEGRRKSRVVAATALLVTCLVIVRADGARATQASSSTRGVEYTLGSGSAIASETEVTELVKWSPFEATGRLRKTLGVHRRKRGGCDSYSFRFTYRCTSGNTQFGPCWRVNAGVATAALCADDPWTATLEEIPAPDLMLDAGVTYDPDQARGDAGEPPWGLELMDGNRCTLFLGGAHSYVPGHEDQVVDYDCDRGGVELVRSLRRGRLWRMTAVRYRKGRYDQLGDLAIHRAYFTGVPAEMERQHRWASSAAATALHMYRRARGSADKGAFVDRVRLVVPQGDWAHVRISGAPRLWNVVLRRVHGSWVEERAFRSYGDVPHLSAAACRRLPTEVRPQLFSSSECTTSTRPTTERRGRWLFAVAIALAVTVAGAVIVRRRPPGGEPASPRN
jgi:hypothetical protein